MCACVQLKSLQFISLILYLKDFSACVQLHLRKQHCKIQYVIFFFSFLCLFMLNFIGFQYLYERANSCLMLPKLSIQPKNFQKGSSKTIIDCVMCRIQTELRNRAPKWARMSQTFLVWITAASYNVD